MNNSQIEKGDLLSIKFDGEELNTPYLVKELVQHTETPTSKNIVTTGLVAISVTGAEPKEIIIRWAKNAAK